MGTVEKTDCKTARLHSKTEENSGRGHWGNRTEFILSLVGYAVGLGNLWRFPYLCMRNGGGAFLIPYFTFMFLCGIPLYFLELALGQFAGLSPIQLWEVCPLLKGLGWGMVIVSGLVALYYNLIIAWVLYYLGMSFTKELPWATCHHEWNTRQCGERVAANVSNMDITVGMNVSLLNSNESISKMVYKMNTSQMVTSTYSFSDANNSLPATRTPAEEFWEFNVLQRSPGIHDFGEIRWELLVALIAAWIIVFACLIKGIKSSGKVVYVTATFPYIFLTAILIRGLTLPGAVDGIIYYLKPDFKRLAQFSTWGEACLQIFYSLGPAYGGLITMSSYCKFHHNCLRDAMLVPLMNSGTSFFAGFIIFSIIGFMAKDAGVPVSEVITSGPGLVFMAYPEAISRMPLSPVWAVLFFLMLLTIGLDTQFTTFETLISGLVDRYPKYLAKRKTLFTMTVSMTCFVLGLPFVTRAGLYYFQIMDWYCAMFSLTFIAFLECIVIAWIYGWRRFYADIAMMLGHEPGQIWRILWCFVTPALMASVIIFSSVRMGEPYYGDYTYPRWAIGMGWVIAMISLVPLPVCAVIELRKVEGTLWERVRKCLRPSALWGPSSNKYRGNYTYSTCPEIPLNLPDTAILDEPV